MTIKLIYTGCLPKLNLDHLIWSRFLNHLSRWKIINMGLPGCLSIKLLFIVFRIFGRTLSLILENVEHYLINCFDAVGLLLMIRVSIPLSVSIPFVRFMLWCMKVTHAQRLIMQRRRIPTLDPFFDRLSMLLWPRFKQVFDANVKSIKGAHEKRLGPIDLSPHFVSRYVHVDRPLSEGLNCS